MNQLMKRVLSVLLVVCLLCSALPSAFAVLGDGIVNGGLGQAVNGIVAAEYTFK